nr:YdcF family protein [Bdellovibrionales bacterium]
TYDHTVYLRQLLKDKPFVLVTSALHMPRSMGLFLKAGYKPIPAPTAHLLTGEYSLFNMKVPFARGDNLEAIDLWSTEFFGIILAKLKGRI